MRKLSLAGLLILFSATAGHAALKDTKLSVRIKNFSSPATYALSYTQHGDVAADLSNPWPFLGYIGKGGLTKEAPPEEQRLGTGEDSGWIKMPTFGSILHIKRQGEKPWRTEIELQLQGDRPDQTLSRKIVWEGEEETLHVYLHLRPVSYKPDVLCLKTFDELMDEDEECVRQALKDCPWKKAPQRLAFYSDPGVQNSDGPAVVQRQLNFLREAGANGIYYCEAPLLPLVNEKGFSYLWDWGASCDVFTVEDPEKLRAQYNSAALSVLGPYERYGMRDKLRGQQLGDENWNGKLQDYLAGGEKTRAHLAGYLQALKVPPSELGIKDYSELRIAPPGVLKESNPALYYWANRVRMEAICDQWKLAGDANARYFPKAWGSPDWSIGIYGAGGYEQQSYDLWMLYRKKALRGIMSEGWSGIEFMAFMVDMMRGEARGQPLIVFELPESGFAPITVHYKVYEELIRGVSDIGWFTCGGLHGDEQEPWQIKRDMVREIPLIHHEAAEAEPYLLDTQLEPAEVALLWTPAQEIWQPGLHSSLTTTYFALLYANYACDFVSSYDVDDGLLDRYKVLYMPFDYVEKRTWEKIREWAEKGGSLVLESVNLRDEYNRPLSLEKWLPGFQAVPVVKGDILNVAPSAYGNNCSLPLIEETKPVPFPVIFSKTVLTAPKGAQVFLTYADGQPAAFSMPKEKGRVTLFGFYPGASYGWDQANKDKGKATEEHPWMVHGYSPALREAVAAPIAQAGIERIAGIKDDMVVARRRVGGGKECVALFDYSFGQPPECGIEPAWENVKERRVKVQLTYPAEKARSLRGKIVARQGNTVEVAFHGLDMILVDEK